METEFYAEYYAALSTLARTLKSLELIQEDDPSHALDELISDSRNALALASQVYVNLGGGL